MVQYQKINVILYITITKGQKSKDHLNKGTFKLSIKGNFFR